MGRIFTASGIVLCLVIICAPAHASLRRGLFRLGLESTFFRLSIVDYDPEDGPDRDFQRVSVGAGIPHAGLNLAGTVANGWVFGGRITLGLMDDDEIFNNARYLTWSVLPYFEYVFLTRVFRPFVTVIAGAEGVAHYSGGEPDTWWAGFKAAGGGGAHFFVHRHVSIDLTLLAGGIIGGGEQGDVKFQHWRFFTSVLFGLSGWF